MSIVETKTGRYVGLPDGEPVSHNLDVLQGLSDEQKRWDEFVNQRSSSAQVSNNADVRDAAGRGIGNAFRAHSEVIDSFTINPFRNPEDEQDVQESLTALRQKREKQSEERSRIDQALARIALADYEIHA